MVIKQENLAPNEHEAKNQCWPCYWELPLEVPGHSPNEVNGVALSFQILTAPHRSSTCPTPTQEPAQDFLMFQTQEKFRKHSTVGRTAWFISYSHSLYSSFHSWKPCQRLSYMTAAFSTIHKLGRWQGGLPRSECQKPGNQPFFLLLISLSPAALHPGPLPFPEGKTSCLFMHLITA